MKLTLNGLKIFEFVKNSGTWFDVDQITHHTGVDTSAVGRWLRSWTKEGLLIRNDSFQAYLYKLAEEYEKLPIGEKLDTALRIFKELEGENGKQPITAVRSDRARASK